MKNRSDNKSDSKKTQPARPSARPPAPIPSELAPVTPFHIAVRPAVNAELGWYFGYAQFALRRDDVALLPNQAARCFHPSIPDETVRAHAHILATDVRHCLASLPFQHASVLRAAYTPRRWPRRIERCFQMLAPIVVRLAVAENPWPDSPSPVGIERATASRLSGAILLRKGSPAARLRRKARRLFGRAVVAYAKARAGKRTSRATGRV